MWFALLAGRANILSSKILCAMDEAFFAPITNLVYCISPCGVQNAVISLVSPSASGIVQNCFCASAQK